MKTILLISRCPPWPLHIGDRVLLWHMTRELARRGHVMDLLALYDREQDPDELAGYRDFFRHVELIPQLPRGRSAYLRRLLQPSTRFAHSPRMSFCPELWRAIERRLRERDYDLAHCFGSVSVYEFYPLLASLPNLITPYESYSLFLQSAARQGRISARLQLPIARRYESFMYTPYDRTVVIGEKDRRTLLSLQPGLDVALIPNGIDLQRFPWRHQERDPATLLFVGNYDYAPNQDAARLLIGRVMPRIWRHLPQARLQLVGNNPPAWMRQVEDPRIEVTGRVPAVQPYLARATAFACPLRIGAGVKNKVLEALSSGLPVVATPLSLDGIAARPGESAIVTPINDFADSVLALLGDEALRERLSRRGRDLVEAQYTWEGTASGYERLFDEITRG